MEWKGRDLVTDDGTTIAYRPAGPRPQYDQASGYVSDAFVTDVVAVLETEASDPIDLIGQSMAEEQKTRFVRRGRNVQRVDLRGASHDAHLDAYEQWVETLRRFLGIR